MLNPILAFGMPSGPELLVIIIVIVVLFGAKKIPEIARSLGRSSGEFKRGIKEGQKAAAEEAQALRDDLDGDDTPKDDTPKAE